MQQKIILFIILILFVVIAFGAGIYYFLFISQGVKTGSIGNVDLEQRIQRKVRPPIPPDPAKQLEEINKNYPEVIMGVIKFFDTKNSFKATLKTDDGTEYILWPAQPKSVYESFGVKNGGKVQVNGKPLEGGKLRWALMKPI
jgi:hypothetical protein